MTQVALPTEGLRIVGQVAMGFPPAPNTFRSVAYANTTPPAPTATWLRVGPDSRVTVYAGKVEYGQGIRTGLAIEVADELRAPLDAVEVILSDTDLVPWDMGTFGSQSTARVGLQLRRAAATAREALLELAANRFDLPVSELVAADGAVSPRHDPSRRLTYGDLVAGQELSREIAEDASLTPADEFTVMGRPQTRVDAVERVTGRTKYSQDILPPGVVHAKIIRPPSFRAKLIDADLSIAERLPGVVAVIRDEDLLAVLAETDEQAAFAARLVQARWEEQQGQPSRFDMPRLLVETAREHMTTQDVGSLEQGFRQADQILEASYYVPYISNAPMEPKAAVAVWEGDHLTLWAGTQRPFGVRSEMAQRFGIPENQVRVITPDVGGGFGSKSYYPVALEAARLARLAGRPVRVAWTREEETVWSTFRPAALIQVKSGFKDDGTIVAWEFTAYHAGERPMIGRRGSESPYDIPNTKVVVAAGDSPLRAGSYRSLGGAVNHFAREAHMDEIAAAVGADPGELRLRHLSHPRFRRVLETAMERFGWQSSKPPSGRGVGLGIGLDVGSYVALCLEVDVQGNEVRPGRVVSALDCGLVVNPEGAKNQTEGAIVMGMGAALYEAIDFENGRLLNSGFARYRVPRINNAPEIEVHLVGDPATPSTGAGEPGIVPMAGALAAAVFDRTGQRIRELPIQRHLS
ncbi:MAG TPA: molybdopterin cofactor-binding domain-containing protein [Dehalococcoidia bacterium]|nr:molybdopterin cofactor-binding domain-containing protein [Dehalococcoidia bacterium]